MSIDAASCQLDAKFFASNVMCVVQAICSSKGDVLNVGFGLGLVDTAIQSNEPRSHTIIEAHPDVLHKVGA